MAPPCRFGNAGCVAAKVEEVQRAPGSSDQEITELKKQKLKIKEEIEHLSAS